MLLLTIALSCAEREGGDKTPEQAIQGMLVALATGNPEDIRSHLPAEGRAEDIRTHGKMVDAFVNDGRKKWSGLRRVIVSDVRLKIPKAMVRGEVEFDAGQKANFEGLATLEDGHWRVVFISDPKVTRGR